MIGWILGLTSFFFHCDGLTFLKTRSPDRSAHTFGSSHQFLEVPQKGLKNNVFKKFTFFFYMFGLIGPIKTFSKFLEVGMNMNMFWIYIFV